MSRKLLKILALLGLVAFLSLVLVQQLAPPAAARQTQPIAQPTAPARQQAPLPLPQVRLAYSAQAGARLTGHVPDEGERQAMLHRARKIYGTDRVQDELHVLPVANPAWLSPAFLPDLRGAHQALAELANGTLTVQAVLPDEAARHRLANVVDGYTANGLQVVSQLQVRPDTLGR